MAAHIRRTPRDAAQRAVEKLKCRLHGSTGRHHRRAVVFFCKFLRDILRVPAALQKCHRRVHELLCRKVREFPLKQNIEPGHGIFGKCLIFLGLQCRLICYVDAAGLFIENIRAAAESVHLRKMISRSQIKIRVVLVAFMVLTDDLLHHFALKISLFIRNAGVINLPGIIIAQVRNLLVFKLGGIQKELHSLLKFF